MLSDPMLRQMVDAMPMPVFVKDDTDTFVYVNRAYETLFQVRADSLLDNADASSTIARAHERGATSPAPQLTETTTFQTRAGEQFTMGMIYTTEFVPTQDSELVAVKAELRQARSELARMRETDPVTQALSRRALRAHAEDTLAFAPAGVLRISVDDLETITEQFGQDIGDDLLADFSDIIRRNTRPGDVFARIDEAEFALVLHEADRDQTASVAHRICAALNDSRTRDGKQQLALSVTVGAAFSDATDTQLSEVIEEAERALRSATPCRNEAIVV